jgi:hypothetical protein
LKCSFILDRESTRGFIVAFLMNYCVDDVEEYFLVWLNRIRTQGTTESTDDFEHGITSSIGKIQTMIIEKNNEKRRRSCITK